MILVTGITGLTGRFLYREIKKAQLDVRYFVRKSSDISWMDAAHDDIFFGDQKNAEEFKLALEGIDSVLHLAPRDKLQNILNACLEKGINRLFYVNSTGIYSRFKSTSHIDLINENTLKNSGLTYTIIRPSMIYGNAQDGNMHLLINIMKKTRIFPVLGSGSGLVHPIYAGDLANFLAAVLLNDEITRFQEYDVAGLHPLRYIDALREIAKSLGKKVWFLHIPYKLALAAGKIGDKFPNCLINYEKVLRLAEDKNFDYSKAREQLGFSPISFAEGIQLEVDAMKKQTRS